MAACGDRPPPPNGAYGPRGTNTFLLDPNSSPRLKAISVAISAWCELHLLQLRAHDLLSTAHLNRIEHIPIGLYHLLDTLKTFEKRYSQMLVKLNQYPDPAHIVFFSKTFSERIFHTGESIETLLSPNLARAAQTRADFRHQLQETDLSLQEYESTIYESVAGPNITRSKVHKVFLPQPHPLEFIPLSIEPPFFNTSGPAVSVSPDNGGLFSSSFIFLRNRRRQLISSMQTLNESRYHSEFSSVDVRDFHHEVDVVESEIALVTNLQRILTTVRMMEDAQANGTPTMSSLPDSNSMASMFQETVELFQPMRRLPLPLNTPAGNRMHMSGSFYGIPMPRPNNSYRGDDRSPVVDHNIGFTSLSSANVNSEQGSSSNNHTLNDHHLIANNSLPPPLSTSRMSEPMSHSWMLPGEREQEREIERSSRNGVRGRWNMADPGRWIEPEYMPFGEDFSGRDGSSRNTGNNTSAFTRVQRNIGSMGMHLRSRASSVTEQSDFGGNLNTDAELNFPTEQLFGQTTLSGYERQNALLQDVMVRVTHLQIASRQVTSILNGNNSHLTDLIIAMDELTRSVAKIQEDLTVLKANAGTEQLYGVGSHSHIPTRNRSEDNWRNIDATSLSSRGAGSSSINMLNQSYESQRSSNGPHGERSSANYREAETPPQRFNFTAAPVNPRVGRAFTPPGNSEQHFDPACNNSHSHFMLNNQIPPGNRANNYWDNFKSYSRLNLLSDCKTNTSGLSPSAPTVAEEHVINSLDEVFGTGSPALRRDSRGDRVPFASASRASLSANFVENIGQKKRNKDQKKQFSAVTPGSPLHTSSSNSSPGFSHDLIVRTRSMNVEAPDTRNPRETAAGFSPIPAPPKRESVSNGVEHPMSRDPSLNCTTAQTQPQPRPIVSPPSSLEVDLVSRDEFLQLNSGAGSSASGNGRSDDSSSSKRELEKLLASPDNTEFATRRRSSDAHGTWDFDLDMRNNAVAKPEPDWSIWPGNPEASAGHDNEDNGGSSETNTNQSSSQDFDRKE